MTTLDGILNRRVWLEQPANGFRVAIDTVLLAAAVPAHAGDRILDLGCGVGGAMLCVACRVPDITGIGIEIQPELVELCRRNLARNGFASGLEVRQSDIASFTKNTVIPANAGIQRSASARPIAKDDANNFDHALMNPPYHEESRHDASPNTIKRIANTETTNDLCIWIDAAAAALKQSGTLTLIHRADRQDEILNLLQNTFGEIEILPLLPKANTATKRIIIRARKGAASSVRILPTLVLHKPEGGYTNEAEAVLRHCKAL